MQGSDGVEKVLNIFKDELKITMQLAGISTNFEPKHSELFCVYKYRFTLFEAHFHYACSMSGLVQYISTF